MSSLAHHAKNKMAGMLQKLLGKLSPPPAGNEPVAPGNAASMSPAPEPTPAKPPPTPLRGTRSNGRGIEFPLQPIIAGLPLELQPQLKSRDAGARTICVPLEVILAQLSSGAVKVPFRDVRQAAPDLFAGTNDRDQVLVSIPLAEVLPRLNPVLITRRREQKLIEVPADIRSPFDRNG